MDSPNSTAGLPLNRGPGLAAPQLEAMRRLLAIHTHTGNVRRICHVCSATLQLDYCTIEMVTWCSVAPDHKPRAKEIHPAADILRMPKGAGDKASYRTLLSGIKAESLA